MRHEGKCAPPQLTTSNDLENSSGVFDGYHPAFRQSSLDNSFPFGRRLYGSL